ncbi:MAG TPA: ferritin family protein [Geomonas sp.]|nr:ferritin family protein [Geomonas sp.]
MNVLDCALKIEKETVKYYKGLQKESSHPELKNLFSLLAASEKEHHDNLIRLRGSLPAEASMPGLEGASCSFSPLLTQHELLNEVDNDPDLYRFTTHEEEEEIKFYESLAAKATDEPTRKSLLKLAEEERKHLTTMENIYDFVEAPKTYLAWGEFSNLHEL